MTYPKYPLTPNNGQQRSAMGVLDSVPEVVAEASTSAGKWTNREASLALTVLLMLLHIPLAIALQHVPVLTVAHAFGTLAVGLWWALYTRRREYVGYVAVYLAGAEVLWRMTNQSGMIPWEFGKYALALIVLVAMCRGRWVRVSLLPLAYFLLLLPAAVVTMVSLNASAARNALSFNLSGPLALMLSVFFFSGLTLSREQWTKLMLWLMAPIVGITALTALHLATTTVVFGRSSNLEASGGFGPNQVSSAMGLGIVAAFFCAVGTRSRVSVKVLCLFLLLGFAIQSALTLSRSGLYVAGISLAAGCVYLLRDRQMRLSVLVSAAALAVMVVWVFPRVDAFTEGALSARFQDTGSTGRDSIAKADLKIFLENPWLGVGVGKAKEERRKYYGQSIIAHTEFTRLPAEHGLLGIGAIILLLAMAMQHFHRARSPRSKAAVVALVSFGFLFMAVNGMRLLLPAVAFGLSAALWMPASSGHSIAESCIAQTPLRGCRAAVRYPYYHESQFRYSHRTKLNPYAYCHCWFGLCRSASFPSFCGIGGQGVGTGHRPGESPIN